MPINSDPQTPLEVYKAIIDELVEEVTLGISERLVRDEGIYSKAPGEAAANRFVQSLTHEQRTLLAQMLHHERIADTLSNLTWWFICQEVRMTFKGQTMPLELSGEGLHGDFIGRCDGWEWPENSH